MNKVIIEGVLKLDETNHRPYVEIDIESAEERMLLFKSRNGKMPDKFVLKIKKHRNFIMRLFNIRISLDE